MFGAVEVCDVQPVDDHDEQRVLLEEDEHEDGSDEALLDVEDEAQVLEDAELLGVSIVVDQDVVFLVHVGELVDSGSADATSFGRHLSPRLRSRLDGWSPSWFLLSCF